MTGPFKVAVVEDQHATVKYLIKLAMERHPGTYLFRTFYLDEYDTIKAFVPNGFIVDIMMDPLDLFDVDEVNGGFSTGVNLVKDRIVPDFPTCPLFVLTGLEAKTQLGAKVKRELQEISAVKEFQFKPIGNGKFVRCLESLRTAVS